MHPTKPSCSWVGPRLLQDNFLLGNIWINVRDPLYFLVYGIPYIHEKGSSFLPGVMWAKILVLGFEVWHRGFTVEGSLHQRELDTTPLQALPKGDMS